MVVQFAFILTVLRPQPIITGVTSFLTFVSYVFVKETSI